MPVRRVAFAARQEKRIGTGGAARSFRNPYPVSRAYIGYEDGPPDLKGLITRHPAAGERERERERGGECNKKIQETVNVYIYFI